jgi:hypothetical protein
MNTFKTQIAAAVLGFGLVLTAGATPRWDHDREYGEVRQIVDRTQSDLRAAADLGHGSHQRDRYKNAQRHLSDFDRSLSKGHFDKDRLDTAIDDLKNLLDHNTLQASARDELMRDIDELRRVREHH